MKKGERRKADILRVAEDFFYTRGYEATTVQDILDELSLSKGGFYHHFESKEQLLEALCEQKALLSAEAARKSVESCPGGAVDKLNSLFDRNGIWQNDNVDFLGLLIRVAYRDDNIVMREKLKRRTEAYTLPLLEEIIAEGVSDGQFFTSYPQSIGRLILLLGENLTDEIASLLLRSKEEPPDVASILELLELYRHAIERLLDAPYGTVVLYQIGTMVDLLQNVWKRHAAMLNEPQAS